MIESYGVQPHAVWLIGQGEHAHEKVPLPDSKEWSRLYPFEFFISPDERLIVRQQKLYHGANAICLYERKSPLHYIEVEPSFSEGAWAFFRSQTHQTFSLDYRFIARVEDWPHGSRGLLISLYGEDGHLHVRDWFCYYDPKGHRFYLTKELAEKNKRAVTPVARRASSHGRKN